MMPCSVRARHVLHRGIVATKWIEKVGAITRGVQIMSATSCRAFPRSDPDFLAKSTSPNIHCRGRSRNRNENK